jgi:integrase
MPPRASSKTELTDKAIRGFGPSSKIYYDTLVDGFGIRVSPAGRKTFVLVAKYDGRNYATRRIGHFPQTTLATARQIAKDWRIGIAAGRDPTKGNEPEDPEPSPTAAPTFGEVADAFCKEIASTKRRGAVTERKVKDEKGHFGFAAWRPRPIAEITSADVSALVRSHVDRGCPSAAHDVFTIARRVFKWSIGAGRYGMTKSPCENLIAGDMRAVVQERDRTLTDGELRAYWAATAEESPPWCAFFRLALLTAVRRRELAGMLWRELDLERKIWTVPDARMKTGFDHAVPLTAEMLKIISANKRCKSGDHVLTMSFGKKGLTDFDRAQTRVQQRMYSEEEFKRLKRDDKRWTLHDMRRTVDTRMADLPIEDVVIESILAHAKKGMARRCNKSQYISKKRAALTTWEHYLMRVIAGESWDEMMEAINAEAA